MAKVNISQLGKGGAGMHGQGASSAFAAIRELQGLKRTVVAGAAANTNMAVAGIATEDTIVSAYELVTGVPTTDRTSTTSITSAGNVQCTAVTTGNVLDIWWFDKK